MSMAKFRRSFPRMTILRRVRHMPELACEPRNLLLHCRRKACEHKISKTIHREIVLIVVPDEIDFGPGIGGPSKRKPDLSGAIIGR